MTSEQSEELNNSNEQGKGCDLVTFKEDLLPILKLTEYVDDQRQAIESNDNTTCDTNDTKLLAEKDTKNLKTVNKTASDNSEYEICVRYSDLLNPPPLRIQVNTIQSKVEEILQEKYPESLTFDEKIIKFENILRIPKKSIVKNKKNVRLKSYSHSNLFDIKKMKRCESLKNKTPNILSHSLEDVRIKPDTPNLCEPEVDCYPYNRLSENEMLAQMLSDKDLEKEELLENLRSNDFIAKEKHLLQLRSNELKNNLQESNEQCLRIITDKQKSKDQFTTQTNESQLINPLEFDINVIMEDKVKMLGDKLENERTDYKKHKRLLEDEIKMLTNENRMVKAKFEEERIQKHLIELEAEKLIEDNDLLRKGSSERLLQNNTTNFERTLYERKFEDLTQDFHHLLNEKQLAETEFDNKLIEAKSSIQELKEENQRIQDKYDEILTENRALKSHNLVIKVDKKNQEKLENELIMIKEKLNDTVERLETSSNEGAIYKRQLDTIKVEMNSLNYQLKLKEEQCQTLKPDRQLIPENNSQSLKEIASLQEKITNAEEELILWKKKYDNLNIENLKLQDELNSKEDLNEAARNVTGNTRVLELETLLRERENQIIKYEINTKLDINELHKALSTTKELEGKVEKYDEERRRHIQDVRDLKKDREIAVTNSIAQSNALEYLNEELDKVNQLLIESSIEVSENNVFLNTTPQAIHMIHLNLENWHQNIHIYL
ncbi:DgyrCDS13166 [Dimorphilus gyrociliatus]|uniref:DgyrCDS13166 n=1 Tax=Dimorphilus gyrociliatus TaxID=2664684 RepID=A0A7I8W9Y6_9ANNE|nr:DgyrCDS13166 [Dimorphilus gyrociliatus]